MNIERIKKSIVIPIWDETIPFYEFAPQIRQLFFLKENSKFIIYKMDFPNKSDYYIKLFQNKNSFAFAWNKTLGQFNQYHGSHLDKQYMFDNIFDPIDIVEHCLDTDNYIATT